MLFPLISLFGFFLGCPTEPAAPVEPAAEPATEAQVEPAVSPSDAATTGVDPAVPEPTTAEAGATAGDPTAGDPTAVDPAATDPTAADPAIPVEAAAAASGTGTVGEASTGATVKLSGTYKFTGSTTGKLRVDVFTIAEDGKQLKLVQAITLPTPGPWEAEVKRGLGLVRVNGFIDTGKPPGDSAPTMSIDRVTVGDNSIKGLDLELVAGGKIKEFGQ